MESTIMVTQRQDTFCFWCVNHIFFFAFFGVPHAVMVGLVWHGH